MEVLKLYLDDKLVEITKPSAEQVTSHDSSVSHSYLPSDSSIGEKREMEGTQNITTMTTMMDQEMHTDLPRSNAEHLRMMINAVDAVISGSMSQREAARAFNIPRSTLRSHLPSHETYKHKQKKTPSNFKGRALLTKKEEKELVEWLISMHRAGFGRTRQDLLLKVQDMLNKAERKSKFENNLPTDEWYEAFLQRHRDSIQQCHFGPDMQERGLIPVDMREVNQVIEAAVQSVVTHPSPVVHHASPQTHNLIYRTGVSPETVNSKGAQTIEYTVVHPHFTF